MLAAMFGLSGLLTLMRPYLFLFLLLPAYFWAAEDARRHSKAVAGHRGAKRFVQCIASGWRGILGSGAIIAAVLGGYAWVNHYLAAPYLEPLFSMDWLTAFFEKGLWGGLRNLAGSLYFAGQEFIGYMRQGLISGIAAGSIFCCYIGMLLLLLCQSIGDFLALRRERREGKEDGKLSGQLALEVHLALAFVGMLGAQLLMKNLYDGCKHLLTFLAAGIFVIAMMRTVYFKKAVFVGALFAFFFMYRTEGFQDYLPDFTEPAALAEMERWNGTVGQELELAGEGRPGYDNTVIWVLSDELPEGTVYTGWQYLYSLPAGFGISCCTSDYVTEKFEDLESGYLCVVPGGPIEASCIRAGYEKIVGNQYAVLYRRD